ncbi:enolase C-terminal domain-like protein [Vibrio nigripulchritudo]|uniref:enolase C-terminal domain-like protein n=1 Tax=Vibrio nigripulchritudo TaxID=28173 RepID=UPI0003B22F13|nr:enolase C-terminal domain-like protein [Vibrio nigripulchritudo]CCN71766.1 putative Glucarate dehydratase [Vibrio nigripulchritudo SFn118]
MKHPKITDIKATTITVPLEAPLRHSNGAHWGRFVRTVVQVETDVGITGLGEMGGGGESAEAMIEGLKQYLVGHDPFELEALRMKICNPTASLYNNRTQYHAAIEFACLDICGKFLGVPVCDLLGGKVRDEVEFASYLFFRFNNDNGEGEVRTKEQLIAHAKALKEQHGFRVHKLKSGVFPPEYELELLRAMAQSLPGDKVRYDPNAAFSVEEAIWFGRNIEDLNNDYYEDPTWGLNGMRTVRNRVQIPNATNTVIINFEQLATNVRDPAVDVILLDTTFWGGIRNCIKAANVCETFQTSVSVHSSGELGIQLATMLHLGAVLPTLTYAADAHYHHLMDDVIQGGKFEYKDGKIRVPTTPGLGVELDKDKLEQYSELYKKLGGYPYDRDPSRPGWFAYTPNTNWADPDLTDPN